jgi:hypothetical protein
MKFKQTTTSLLPVCVLLVFTTIAAGQELKESLKDIDVGDRWSYNDWESAKAAASKSKKPILALFR